MTSTRTLAVAGAPAISAEDVAALMNAIGGRAREAAARIARADSAAKDLALRSAAARLRAAGDTILEANALDVADLRTAGATLAVIDRGTLSPERIEAMAAGLEAIAGLPDPVGTVMAEWRRPNGLAIQRVRTPIGVIGVIFESRPNVTADAGALCLKSGNAVILRGGKEALHSSQAIVDVLRSTSRDHGIPSAAIQLVQTVDRAAVEGAATEVRHPGRGVDRLQGIHGAERRREPGQGVAVLYRRPRFREEARYSRR